MAVVYRRSGAVRCDVRVVGFAGFGARHVACEPFGRRFPSLLFCWDESIFRFRRRSVSTARHVGFRLPIRALPGVVVSLSRLVRLWESGGRSRGKPMAVVVCEVRLGRCCNCCVLLVRFRCRFDVLVACRRLHFFDCFRGDAFLAWAAGITAC